MDMNDLILISVDDHVIEPPNLFDKHLPARYKDIAPRLVTNDKGADTWVYDGQVIPNFGLNAVVGRPPEEYGMEPTAYSQIRHGTFDVAKRVEDMNADGVLAAICFPTFPHFAGNRLIASSDKRAALAIIQAYNDWHIEDWCGAAPGRFIPLSILPLWDVQACVTELKRVAAKGCRTVTFPDNPAAVGLPSIHLGYWDPLWQAAVEERIVISSHIGSGNQAPHSSMDSPIDALIVTMPMAISNAAADWLFSPVFKKFPDLRLSLAEGGIGWIPYLLERADFVYKHHHAWTNADFGELLPSELFKRNVLTCFIDDQFGLHSTDFLNMDMVAWECDYPHSDCVWPKSPETVWSAIKHLPKELIDKATHLNAMREFRFDPFASLGRDNCTVGALRAKATHVNVTPVAGMGGHNPSNHSGQPVTSGEVVKMFA